MVQPFPQILTSEEKAATTKIDLVDYHSSKISGNHLFKSNDHFFCFSSNYNVFIQPEVKNAYLHQFPVSYTICFLQSCSQLLTCTILLDLRHFCSKTCTRCLSKMRHAKFELGSWTYFQISSVKMDFTRGSTTLVSW